MASFLKLIDRDYMRPRIDSKYSYDTIRSSLNTGDIVLFGGFSTVSMVIRRFTYSWVSHVGLVYRPSKYGPLLLLESTTGPDSDGTLEDIITRKPMKGVQLVQLSQKIKQYNGWVAFRKLVNWEWTEERTAQFELSRKEFHGRPYEESYIGLVSSAVDIVDLPYDDEEDLTSLFCSELCAEVYERCGILDEDTESSDEYVPADFSATYNDGPLRSIALWQKLNGVMNGARLGEEIFVKEP